MNSGFGGIFSEDIMHSKYEEKNDDGIQYAEQNRLFTGKLFIYSFEIMASKFFFG